MIGIRSTTNGSAEKEKMRNSLRVIVEQLMGLEGFDEMLAHCRVINQLEESQVDQICQNDYYEMKIADEFEYKRNPEEEQQEAKEDAEMATEKKNMDSKEDEKAKET